MYQYIRGSINRGSMNTSHVQEDRKFPSDRGFEGVHGDLSGNEQRLGVRTREVARRGHMNGASWHEAAHHVLALTGATEAPSRGWGGLVRGPGVDDYVAAGDFPDDWSEAHINVQEAYALWEMTRLFCAARPEQVAGSTVLVDVDNKTLFYAFLRGKARDSRMHEVIPKLFWLQIDRDFTLRLRWV